MTIMALRVNTKPGLRKIRRWVLVGVIYGLISPLANALTLEEVEAQKVETVMQVTDPESRSRLDELHEQAKNSLRAQSVYGSKLESYKRNTARRPVTRKELNGDIAEFERRKSTLPVSQRERTLDAIALDTLVELTRSERATLQGKLGGYELKLRTLAARPTELAKEKAAAEARLTAIDAERTQLIDDANDALSRALSTAYEAEFSARQTEIEMLSLEQASFDGAREITSLRRDLVLLNLDSLSARITALEELLIERREAVVFDVQKLAELAQSDAVGTHPLAQEIATETLTLSKELAALVQQQSAAVRRRAEYAERKNLLNTEYETARQRLLIAGTSAILGRILVDQRRQLPSVSNLEQQAKFNATEVSRVSLRRIELEERSRAVQIARENPAKYASAGLLAEAITPQLEEQLKNLLNAQEGLLTNIETNSAAYLRVLDATDSELRQLTNTVSLYTELLDQRLLWIPNTTPWSIAVFKGSIVVVRGLFNTAPWMKTLEDLRVAIELNAVRSAGFILFVIIVYHARHRLRRFLATQAEKQQRPGDRRVRDTLSSLVAIAVFALPMPLLFFGIGEALKASPSSSELSLVLSQTLQFAAVLLLVAGWWKGALGSAGIVGAHFGVAADATRRSQVAWNTFARTFIPTYSVALNFEWPSGAAAQNGLTRIFFVMAMLSLFIFAYWLNRRNSPFSGVTFGITLERLRPLRQIAMVGPPLIFALLSAMGYHYTAVELSKYYLMSGLLISLAILVNQISLRWLTIAGYRMQVTRRLNEEDGRDSIRDAKEIEKFNAQARLVARNVIGWSLALGLWGVWQTVLPALTVLEGINLWDVAIDDQHGVATLQAVTIASLALAAVIGLVTIVASRNLPGVLEVGLLQRAGVDHGSRYAISKLLQYAIVAIGLSMMLSTLGVRWSQVQWLVAALGVGLGFGLQEIFANFISGLILLFERPIRVGDVVTIGEMTGKVSRIRIRATTICDGDNKEIVVPNKTFITDRFVNWTLSDQVTRIVLKVGIAYGADLELAMRLLQDLAEAHSKVMRDPAPQVVLTGFGDSALFLELEVYAEELGHRVNLRHDLNTGIHREFKAHGIQIPFPQRDIHIRSDAPLERLETSVATTIAPAPAPCV